MKLDYKYFNIKFEKNTVIIAGAGPGSEKLITLKLKYILGISDVVIYDALVNKSILKLCNKKVLLIYAGKTKKQSCTQSDINNLMIKYANQNKRVLRLKGGDVSFFSRGSQEVEFLKKNKINFQVISAISSSQASLKAINQNFFDENKICNLFTGHKKVNSRSKAVDYNFLSKNNGRIFIYMGISQIKYIIKKLLLKGVKSSEKVSIVTNASLANQKIFKTNIRNCASFIKKNKITSPAIIVIR
tara:strand:- start:396 stop:1127 length:732 start_codon:yes stop_codon:yes gene_type:complete